MTARDRMLMIVIGVAAVLGGFWFLALSPKRAESTRVQSEISAAKVQLADATSRSAAVKAAERSYGADTAAVAMLGKAVPATDQTDALLYQLDAAAGGSKVRLTSVTPTAPDPTAAAPATPLPGGVTELALSMTFEGKFADLERFLRRINGATRIKGDTIDVHGRLLSIKGVKLTPDPDTGVVTATVTASAYIASTTPPATDAATTPATPAPSGTASTAPPTQPAAIGAGG